MPYRVKRTFDVQEGTGRILPCSKTGLNRGDKTMRRRISRFTLSKAMLVGTQPAVSAGKPREPA